MEVACVLIPDSALAGPVEAGELTELLLRRLERIGAAVESERVGEAFFALDGLRGIHGGKGAGVLDAARRVADMQVRTGVAPTRFAAHAAAQGEAIVPPAEAGDFLAGLPVSALAGRLELPPREAGSLVETLRRLGIERLGELAALSRDLVADRFGTVGLEALCLARGEERPLRPRQRAAGDAPGEAAGSGRRPAPARPRARPAARAAQGADSLLKVVPLDSASRFPECWAMLAPTVQR